MKIALVDVDGHNFPNLALMKLSAWHKAHGDSVEWYSPLFSRPEKIYASKVFTFTPDYLDYAPNDPEPEKGGTGYGIYQDLPEEIDRMNPDCSIYPQYPFTIGFLSRGCIRNCPWCVVPKKEGTVRRYDDIERIAQGRKHVVLMDNNFLANDRDFVREQLEKARKFRLCIDFNQGLDARLINEENARWLAACRWEAATGNNSYIRFSCDTDAMVEPVQRAIRLLRNWYKGAFFVYFLATDVGETLWRITEIMNTDPKVNPFVMPYRDFEHGGEILSPELADLARWCNSPAIRKTCKYKDYRKPKKQKPPAG